VHGRGTDQAVARTGKTDGYFGNPLIKILVPEKLQALEKGVRAEERNIRKNPAARVTTLLKEVFSR